MSLQGGRWFEPLVVTVLSILYVYAGEKSPYWFSVSLYSLALTLIGYYTGLVPTLRFRRLENFVKRWKFV